MVFLFAREIGTRVTRIYAFAHAWAFDRDEEAAPFIWCRFAAANKCIMSISLPRQSRSQVSGV